MRMQREREYMEVEKDDDYCESSPLIDMSHILVDCTSMIDLSPIIEPDNNDLPVNSLNPLLSTVHVLDYLLDLLPITIYDISGRSITLIEYSDLIPITIDFKDC